jgi:hypothetical protein
MAYTITKPDGTTLVLLADQTIDKESTSLTLVGRNWAGYGEIMNNNLVALLCNSANSSSNPPINPLKGQLWYDTTAKRLKIYDDAFKPLTGALISSTQPTTITNGDIWWDTTNDQLKVFVGNTATLVGPAFPKFVGENGWILPRLTFRDTALSTHDVTLLKNYGDTLGYIASEAFVIENTTTNFSYITTITTATVRGMTILADVHVAGNLYYDEVTPSDANLKENIAEITDPITKISKIRGVSFDWTEEYLDSNGGVNRQYYKKHDIGVIAQEIEQVLPEIVATKKNGYKGLRYEKLTALLIEAVKAQQDKINEQEERIRSLEDLFKVKH